MVVAAVHHDEGRTVIAGVGHDGSALLLVR